MSDLIVIGFDSPHKAEEVRTELIKMQRSYLVDLEDAVVAEKREDGKVKLNQIHNLTAHGAIGGSFWGLLIGLLFLSPLLGAVAGAAAGAVAGALSDIGISNDFMKDLSEMLAPGHSALFVLTRKAPTDKVLKELERFEGRVIRTSLSSEDDEKLRQAFETAKREQANQEAIGNTS